MKNTIIAILVLAVLGFGFYAIKQRSASGPIDTTPVTKTDTSVTGEIATTTDTVMTDEEGKEQTVIGKSIEGRDITAYHYGTGGTELLFIGGIHGGYSWNTSLVAYEMIDYLKANLSVIPAQVKVTVIPVLNPDGLYKVTGADGMFTASQVSSSQAVQTAGRFNAHTVDLNRNFDCKWQSTGTWQNTPVSGGDKAFSEVESVAIKKYAETHKLGAVVVWYSAAGGVYSSSCERGVLSATKELTALYANASGYPAHESFDFYETTGDMANWFAKENIPAISVLLTNHTDTEWTKNKAGIEAVLKSFVK